MDYYLIKGHFHVVGYSPDGDSLMFEASDAKNWDKILTQHREIFDDKLEEKGGSVQLRLQGIDALETHYGPSPFPPPKGMSKKKYAKAKKPKAGHFRQPDTFGDAATAKILDMLGVEETTWGSKFGIQWIKSIEVKKGRKTETVSKKGEDKLEGYIIINDMDRKGRPISWIFPGKSSRKDGSKITTKAMASMVKKSINYKLVALGLVYPYFFMTLSAKLRQKLMDGLQNAQRQKYGLWAEDRTEKGIPLKSMAELTDKHLVFPYLFRRMIKHQFKRQNEAYYEAVKSKKAFDASTDNLYLDTFFDDTNPYVFLIKERDFVRLDTIVKVTKTQLKLMTHPGNIVFLS
jgi:endonuclease YncB( thermonuclease family)